MKKLILTALICLFSISAYAKQGKSCFKTKYAGFTAVYCAAEGGNVELVEKFISMGAKVTKSDVYEIRKLKASGKWNKELPTPSN